MKYKLYYTEHNYGVSKCGVCLKKMNPTPLGICLNIPEPDTINAGQRNFLAKSCKIEEHLVYVISDYRGFTCSKECALFFIFRHI
jgi:hypothetical protein